MTTLQVIYYYARRVVLRVIKSAKTDVGESIGKFLLWFGPLGLLFFPSANFIAGLYYAGLLGYMFGKIQYFNIVLGEKIVRDDNLYFYLEVKNVGYGKVKCLTFVNAIVDQYGNPIFKNLPAAVHWRNENKTDLIPIGNVPYFAGIFITPFGQKSVAFDDGKGNLTNGNMYQVPIQYNNNITTYVHPRRMLTKLYFNIIVEVDIDDSLIPIDQWYVMERRMDWSLLAFGDHAIKCNKPIYETPPTAILESASIKASASDAFHTALDAADEDDYKREPYEIANDPA